MAARKSNLTPGKIGTVVNLSRVVGPATAPASLTVGIRVRPLLKSEISKGGRRDIIRVLDGRVVLVLDPDATKDYLDQVQNRTKEKRYTFDIAFDTQATNHDVYDGTVKNLVSGVLHGINTTVFAYGATGSGKTYTMVGTPNDPGLMVLSLQKIFQDKENFEGDENFDVTCSYLEVYNEVIYDLLVKNSGPLELREDPELGVQVAGLRSVSVETADAIMELLEEGNKRRKTESTEANATSSRSHAVLEITVKRTPRNHYKVQQMKAKLSLVDLAGSERAAETNNAGQKLRDGANINRSLLALANCINALGKQARNVYVPYRNSKLTRLLKDGLSGNSRTAMIATVSASSDQYHHSINTLKYADRAKEIKTHIVQNVGTVESHVADYQRIIDHLQGEVQALKSKLADRPSANIKRAPTPPSPESTLTTQENDADMLAWIDNLVQEMNDNIEERINLQKALFEIEDMNVCNKYELKSLEEYIVTAGGSAREIADARERKVKLLEAIKENDESKDRLKADIQANEEDRRSIQTKIDSMVEANQNTSFLKILGTFRLQAVRLQEVKFQMAVRDQIISEQRDVISNLWRIIERSGVSKERVMDIAREEGIIMDGFLREEEGPPAVGASEISKQVNIQAESPSSIQPQVSLVGGRAKYRYRFWREYESGHEDECSDSSSSESTGQQHGRVKLPKARRNRKEIDRINEKEVRISMDDAGGRVRAARKPDKQLPSARRRGAAFKNDAAAGVPNQNHRSPYAPLAARVPIRSQSDVGQGAEIDGGGMGAGRLAGQGNERRKVAASARGPGERVVKSGRRATTTGRISGRGGGSDSDDEPGARDASKGKKRISEGGEALVVPVVMPGHFRRASIYESPPTIAESRSDKASVSSAPSDVSIAWPDKANQTAPPVERRGSMAQREASLASVQQLPLNERLAKLKGRLAGLGISRRPTASDADSMGVLPRPPSLKGSPDSLDLLPPLDNSLLPPSNMPGSRRSSAMGSEALLATTITDPSPSSVVMPTLFNGMGLGSGNLAPAVSPIFHNGSELPPTTAEVTNAMGILGLGPRPDSGRSGRTNYSGQIPRSSAASTTDFNSATVPGPRSSESRSLALQQMQQQHRRQLLDKLLAKKETT